MISKARFLLPEGSPVPKGIPLAGPSSSHQATEAEGDLGPSEEEFGVFDRASPSEDPFGDLGNLDLSEVNLLSVGTSSQAEIGLKRKPPTSLFDLIKGQPGKSQSKLPPPPPQPQPAQTRSSSTQLQPSSPRSRLPPPPPIDSASSARAHRSKKEEGCQRQGAHGWGEISFLLGGR